MSLKSRYIFGCDSLGLRKTKSVDVQIEHNYTLPGMTLDGKVVTIDQTNELLQIHENVGAFEELSSMDYTSHLEFVQPSISTEDIKMAEGGLQQTNTLFIDVATGSDRYPIKVSSEPNKEDTETRSTSPIDPYLAVQPRRIRCPECSRFTAETEEKMLRHIRKVHRGENPFQCYMCDYSTYNKVLFEEHVRIHQGIKPYKCSHCPYRSASKKNTKKHEQIHRPDNPHKCGQCDFIGRHVKSLKHHQLSHVQTDLKQCHLCNNKFASGAAYDNHRKSRKRMLREAIEIHKHPNFNREDGWQVPPVWNPVLKIIKSQTSHHNVKRCPECKDMVCVSKMAKHRLEKHGVQKKRGKYVVGTVEKKKVLFTCAICKWEGNNKPKILLHLIHHPNQEVDESVVDIQVLRETGIMPKTYEVFV